MVDSLLLRVMWLYRNNAYGFLYNLFSRPLEFDPKLHEHGIEDSGEFWYLLAVYPSSFKLEVQIPLYGKRHISINIGWKAHKGFPRLMYANRFIGFREYK